jgi:hypothetical protein
VLIGGTGSSPVDLDALQARLAGADHSAVRASLAEVQFGSLFDLLGTYAGRASDLRRWLEDAEINSDRSLHLQYLAGLSFYSHEGAIAYREMIGLRRFPEDMFCASETNLKLLRDKLPTSPLSIIGNPRAPNKK